MSEKKTPHVGPTTWTKGKSGNPGGRSPRVGPNGETWTQLLRAMTPKAAATIDRLLGSPDDEIALKALAMWQPYAWGKPPEGDGGNQGGKTAAEELLALLAAKLPD